MKLLFKTFATTFLFVSVLACNNNTQENDRSDLDSDPEIIENDNTLANNYKAEREEWKRRINEDIDDIENRMEKVGDDSEIEAKLEQAKQNLEDNLDKVEKSSEDNWNEVKEDISDAYNDVKRELNRMANDIDEAVN
ncbi:hypothetical protein GCM10011506_42790 [Marivirga lumbricoides]|uniref:Uncharacterized protein n=1 Tax=Marivirga lumbricoides TaxID=1046115 RepID=A0ABQ1N404_9BACT|nr:hypothetical protein GCM10011506_42790 [Marivirga lumbricoides]